MSVILPFVERVSHMPGQAAQETPARVSLKALLFSTELRMQGTQLWHGHWCPRQGHSSQ